ncbi:hypothetical protein FGO68_gene13249 [Halteria grandinella]|uniref:LITAF domain-containing protein n=1 Tax=Halteria grandinella TaxID=5974 RepID=A0A8J8NC10_HALGN|nr:hypothetical protein FGO68_gene13249 [Halteria grandinella]
MDANEDNLTHALKNINDSQPLIKQQSEHLARPPPPFTISKQEDHQNFIPSKDFKPEIQVIDEAEPAVVRCQSCNYEGVSRTEIANGRCVRACCIVCCLTGILILCSPIVYCFKGLKDVQHYCQNCNALVAVRKPCC